MPHRRLSRLLAVLAAGLLAIEAARAAPPSDPYSIVTIQGENSSISSASLTDRYYTNGLRLSYTSPTDTLPRFLADADRLIWGDGRQRIAVDVFQQIFTPANTQSRAPVPGDRPYAGVLALTTTLINDTDRSRSTLGVSLGLIGPDAQGEQVQNGFHDLIGQNHNLGWKNQLHDEPIIEIVPQRIWRYDLAQFGGFELDTLPALQVGIGNYRDYAQAGARFRFGQGLHSDFGPVRLVPGLNGSDAYTAVRPFAWYVFSGFDGQLVGKDITLNGNSFRNSLEVTPKPFVGELEAGLALLYAGFRLTYTQVFQTEQFKHQRGGLHQFGSIALSAHF